MLFPCGGRLQGVYYTQTELDLHFGRLAKKVRKSKKEFYTRIKCINNTQREQCEESNREAEARRIYRKWDNVKHVCEKIKNRRYPRAILNPDNPLWRLSIWAKERQSKAQQHNLKFWVVIALREMYNKKSNQCFHKK